MDVPEQGMLSISVTIYKKPLSLLFIYAAFPVNCHGPFRMGCFLEGYRHVRHTLQRSWQTLDGALILVHLWFRMNNSFLLTSLTPTSLMWEFALDCGEMCQFPGMQRLPRDHHPADQLPLITEAALEDVEDMCLLSSLSLTNLKATALSETRTASLSCHFTGNLLQELSMWLCLRLVTICKAARMVASLV